MKKIAVNLLFLGSLFQSIWAPDASFPQLQQEELQQELEQRRLQQLQQLQLQQELEQRRLQQLQQLQQLQLPRNNSLSDNIILYGSGAALLGVIAYSFNNSTVGLYSSSFFGAGTGILLGTHIDVTYFSNKPEEKYSRIKNLFTYTAIGFGAFWLSSRYMHLCNKYYNNSISVANLEEVNKKFTAPIISFTLLAIMGAKNWANNT